MQQAFELPPQQKLKQTVPGNGRYFLTCAAVCITFVTTGQAGETG